MLKKRLIGSVLTYNGLAVQSIGFRKFLPIGKPQIAVEFLNQWGIDEIFLAEIGPNRHHEYQDLKLIKLIASECNVPLTVAGGISSVEQMRNIIQAGADKIALCSAAVSNKRLIEEGADVFGCQAIVVSIDYDINAKVLTHSASQSTDENLGEFALQMEKLGAGEIVLRAAERDGSRMGFDIETIDNVCKTLTVPCIAAGGAGHPQHFVELMQRTTVSAAMAGNFFNHFEHSVICTKSYLRKAGIAVRLDTHADYKDYSFDSLGRALPKSEEALLALKYVHVEKETI